jgi:predicted nuclease with TOPRIM domain
MGFLVAFSRKMYLTAYVNHLQVKLNDITSQKLNLLDTISKISTEISDIGNTDSPAVKQLEARKAELENMDKQLEIRMQKIQTQLSAANTELQSADQMLQQGIKSSFTYNIG